MTRCFFPPIYGLVLGGGRSLRMGVDKATLAYHGRPQIEIVLELLQNYTEKQFLSIRPEQAQEKAFSACPQIVDLYPGEGPLGGIVSAQASFPEAAWLVLACDLPFLDTATLAYLIEQRQPEKTAISYLSNHDGLVEPLCALYEPASAPLLAARFGEGLRCARKALNSLQPVTLRLPRAQALDNANTPQDREQALQTLGRKEKNLT
jgi:molybdenum cofactor guanylyltransferase